MKLKKIREENDMKGLVLSFYLMISLLPACSVFAAPLFTASVDKTHIGAGESITLTLTYHGQSKEEPDLSLLEKDFSITSRQLSQESTFINGNFQAKTHWILEIFPKSAEKNVVIPEISLGKDKTKPIHIVQTEEQSAGSEGLMLTVTTDRDNVYVNGELIVRIEIKTSLPLRNGSLSKPQINDAIVEPLITNEQREVIEGGIKYHVFFKSFAVFPSKPGKLIIPSFIFNGVVTKPKSSQPMWPDFFAQGTRVSARSSQREIEVKDVPADFPVGEPFLPLKSFLVIESVDEAHPKFETNKAFARHFELKAKGSLSSFLPSIKEPVVEHLSIYPEDGQKAQKNTEDGIEASRKVSHIYMPSAPGTIVVPEHTIYWWDVDSDTLKTTIIRAFEMRVEGNASPNLAPPLSDKNPALAQEGSPSSELKNKSWITIGLIILSLIILVGLILLSVYFFKLSRLKYSKNNPDKDEFNEVIKNIVASCDKKDFHNVYAHLQALRVWANKYHQTFLIDTHLATHMIALERSLFSSHQQNESSILLSIKNSVTRLRPVNHHKAIFAPLYPR
jgi:hypothetical protein